MSYYTAVLGLIRSEDVDSLRKETVRELAKLANGEGGALYRWNPNNRRFYRSEQFLMPQGRDAASEFVAHVDSETLDRDVLATRLMRYSSTADRQGAFLQEAAWEIVIPYYRAGDELEGVFVVSSRENRLLRRVVAECQHIVDVFSICSTRLCLKRDESGFHTEVLQLGKRAAEGTDFLEFYRSCLRALIKSIPGAQYACIWLHAERYRSERRLILRAASSDACTPDVGSQRLMVERTAIGKALLAGRPAVWDSIGEIPQFHDASIAERLSDHSLVAVPFEVGGRRPAGVVTVYMTPGLAGGRVDDSMVLEIRSLVNHLGILIAQAIWAEKRRAIDGVFEAATDFLSRSPQLFDWERPNDYLSELAVQISQAMSVGALSIFFFETDSSSRMHLFSTTGVTADARADQVPYLDLERSTALRDTIRSGEPLGLDAQADQADDAVIAEEGRHPEILEAGGNRRSYLLVPVALGVKPIGLVRLRGKQSGVEGMLDFFDAEDVELARLVGALFYFLRNLRASQEANFFGRTLAGHDMRNSLGVILSAARLLYSRVDEKPAFVTNLMGNIKDNIQLLTFLTKVPDVFSYWEPEYSEVGFVGDILGPAMGLIRGLASREGIRAYYDSPQFDSMPRFWGDRNRLRELVFNLLLNSIKYTSEDSPRREVRVSYAGVDNDYMRVDFSDFGIGIPEEDGSRIFEIGERTDEARRVAFEGQGKGLPAARLIARRHGGDVIITSWSQPTTFSLLLPRRLAGGMPDG